MQRVIQLQSGKLILRPDASNLGVQVELQDDSGGRAETTAAPDQCGLVVEAIHATLALEPVES